MSDDNDTTEYSRSKSHTADKYRVKKTSSYSSRKKKNKQNFGQQLINDKSLYEGLGFSSRKEFLTKEFEEIVNKNTKIKLKNRYFCHQIFCGKCCRHEDVELVNKARNNIRKDLDVYLVLDHIKEIEKIKTVPTTITIIIITFIFFIIIIPF